ncbi:MAG: sugar ABC transporter ATP-binding protein [Bacteroidota bacterium]
MDVILEMKGISKEFPGVRALDRVNLSVARGEVHALLGENGAGKSTLIKILAGLHHRDAGEITFDGRPLGSLTAEEVQDLGIGFIHQERTFIPYFTVGQMLFLGREPRSWNGLIDWGRLYRDAETALQETLGLELDPKALMNTLTVSERQLVDIAKVLLTKPRLIVFDEPTGPLSEGEIERLFGVIRRLKASGVTAIYISHRLDEVFQICDRATVLKDGQNVGTVLVSETNPDAIVGMMVGKELGEKFPKIPSTPGRVIFRARNLARGRAVKDVSFDLRAGEILGIYGLVGAGRTELVRLIFGADRRDAGTLEVDGKQVNVKSPRHAIDHGIALVPEDRRGQGLVVEMAVRDNVTLPSLLSGFSRFGMVRRAQERQTVDEYIRQLAVKTPSRAQFVKYLSGGNQQKVVLAKWLCSNARVFIFDQPTVGIDVGAKTEIYRLMGELAAKGAAVILVSSEIPEILGLADRILVMYRGRVETELDRAEATPEKLLFYAMGGGVASVQA